MQFLSPSPHVQFPMKDSLHLMNPAAHRRVYKMLCLLFTKGPHLISRAHPYVTPCFHCHGLMRQCPRPRARPTNRRLDLMPTQAVGAPLSPALPISYVCRPLFTAGTPLSPILRHTSGLPVVPSFPTNTPRKPLLDRLLVSATMKHRCRLSSMGNA